MQLKLNNLLQGLLFAAQLQPTMQAPSSTITTTTVAPPYGTDYPRRTIANVTVIDTPIVRAAQDFARAHMSDFVFKHVMRGWLLGALVAAHNATLAAGLDLEVHAVAALLHDLGWDRTPGSVIVSADRRFEVDGAFAARDFVVANATAPGDSRWDARRLQLVWDAIALHPQRSIFQYKEVEVQVAGFGITADFLGPLDGITRPEFDAVVAEFPRDDLQKGVNDTLLWLCQSKPVTTYGESCYMPILVTYS